MCWEPTGVGRTGNERLEDLAPQTGPGAQNSLCRVPAFPGSVSESICQGDKAWWTSAKPLAAPPSPPETETALPSGSLCGALINYERLHLHVRGSAKKLDKIDPPQFILSIFPRNGLPPMFYSWRHRLCLLSPTLSNIFNLLNLWLQDALGLGRRGGHPDRAGAPAASTAPGVSAGPALRSQTGGGSSQTSPALGLGERFVGAACKEGWER